MPRTQRVRRSPTRTSVDRPAERDPLGRTQGTDRLPAGRDVDGRLFPGAAFVGFFAGDTARAAVGDYRALGGNGGLDRTWIFVGNRGLRSRHSHL